MYANLSRFFSRMLEYYDSNQRVFYEKYIKWWDVYSINIYSLAGLHDVSSILNKNNFTIS